MLRILAGDVRPDSGEVAVRKRIRLSYVEQDSTFHEEDTVRSVAQKAMERASLPESERGTRFAETLGRAGFEDLEAKASALSGGWRKRLAIVEAVVQGPDILLLDEPTNHLDLAGIEWLEELLEAAPFACVVVSHDRYFLENIATDMAELNRTILTGCCGSMEVTVGSSRRRKNSCMLNRSDRRLWRTWCIARLNGFAGERRHGLGSRKRASTKLAS